MNIRTSILPALLVGALLASSSVYAQQTSASLQVNLTVKGTCVVSTTSVNFVESTSTAITARNATGKVNINCSPNVVGTIRLNQGNGGGTVAARKMKLNGGTATVDYTLRITNAQGNLWGDGSNGTSTVTHSGTGAVVGLDVYGQVPAQTADAPGVYQDTVPVVVTW